MEAVNKHAITPPVAPVRTVTMKERPDLRLDPYYLLKPRQSS